MATPAIVPQIPDDAEIIQVAKMAENRKIYLEHYFDLKALEDLGVSIQTQMADCGIQGYFNLKEHVILGLIELFFKNLSVEANQVESTVLGVNVVVNVSTIAQAVGCECVENAYTKQWMRNIGGVKEVEKVILKEGEKMTTSGLYAKLNEGARIYHQVLNKSILHRSAGQDGITDVHKFCLFHMLSGIPFNLPQILFRHWKGTLSTKNESVYHSMLLNKIFWDQGVVHKFYELPEAEQDQVTALGPCKRAQAPTFGRANLGRMNLSFLPPLMKVKKEVAEEAVPKKPRTEKKTTAPSVQRKRKLILHHSSSEESSEEDSVPLAEVLKRKPLPKKAKPSEVAPSSLPTQPINPQPSSPVYTETSSAPPVQTIIPETPQPTPLPTPAPENTIAIRKRKSSIALDVETSSVQPTIPKPKPVNRNRHPLLPKHFPDHYDVYDVVFPGTDNPDGEHEIISPIRYCSQEMQNKNKIGNRRKPRPEIWNKKISVFCELYPITWPGKYMLQKPRPYTFGYHKPVYSWIPYGKPVLDDEGKPRLDIEGNPLVYDSLVSPRPTFGPEYYYRPNPPPHPSFDHLISPYIEKPYIPDPPTIIRNPPSYHYKFYPTPSGLPPLPLQREDSDSAACTYNLSMIEYPAPLNVILPPKLIKAAPWKPPQGAVQTVHPIHRRLPRPIFHPKVEFFLPASRFAPIPAHSYRNLSQSDLAMIGHLKLCPDVPNQLFIPPSLFVAPDSQIFILPDRTTPNLPILNLNKLKEPYVHPGPMPKPSRFEIIPEIHSFNIRWEVRSQSDAEKQKDTTLFLCHKKASSSSLSQEEKAKVPTVAGTYWQSFDSKLFHFSDTSVAFLEKGGGPDLDALSKEFFIHAAMFDLPAYRKEWKAVTDKWPVEPIIDRHFDEETGKEIIEKEEEEEEYCEEIFAEEEPEYEAAPIAAAAAEEPAPASPSRHLASSSSMPASETVSRSEFAEFKEDVEAKFNMIISLLSKKD